MPDDYETNLLRWIAAEIYFSLGMQASREMYAKSYFSLGVHEKVAVDNAVVGAVRANYQGANPEWLVQMLGQEQPKTPAPKPSAGFPNPNPKA